MQKVKNKSFSRGDKIASTVLRHVAGILARDFSEGILGMVSLSGAESHGGLQFVRLYYYLNNGADKKTAAAALEKGTKHIRLELAKIMNQKFTPDIRFQYDDTLEKSQHIEELLRKVNEQ